MGKSSCSILSLILMPSLPPLVLFLFCGQRRSVPTFLLSSICVFFCLTSSARHTLSFFPTHATIVTLANPPSLRLRRPLFKAQWDRFLLLGNWGPAALRMNTCSLMSSTLRTIGPPQRFQCVNISSLPHVLDALEIGPPLL